MHYVSRNTVHLSVTATRRMRRHAVADTEDGSKLHSRKLQIMIHRVDSCRPDLRSSLTYHGKANRAFERSRLSKKGARGLSPGEMHHQLATSTGCLHKEAKPTPGLLQCLPCLYERERTGNGGQVVHAIAEWPLRAKDPEISRKCRMVDYAIHSRSYLT